MPIQVRYAPALGVFLLLAGVFILFGGLVTGRVLGMGLGALHTLVAIGFLTQPMFVVHTRRVEMKNILGMTLKTIDVRLAELEVRDGALYHEGRKIGGGMIARGADMERLTEVVNDAREGRARVAADA